MSMPGDDLSSTPVAGPLLSPDSLERLNLLEDFERGGVALNDPTQGLDVRDWRGYTDGEGVWVIPYPAMGVAPALQFTGAGITEVSLAFDQNMQPTIAYVEAGLVKLWWFDSLTSTMVTTSYPDATGPMVTLDDKRAVAGAGSDVIFAYCRGGFAYYRQQRERFGVEHLLGATFGASRILQLGMGSNNRLQFKMMSAPVGRHTDLATDTVYLVIGEDLLKLEGGEVEAARWQSRVFVANEVPPMGWARVDGDYPLTLRVYGDGELQYVSPPITSPDPFRLPAGRWREWSVELEGEVRAVGVMLAHAMEELQ